MGVGAGLYMYDVVVKSSRSLSDEFLSYQQVADRTSCACCQSVDRSKLIYAPPSVATESEALIKRCRA